MDENLSFTIDSTPPQTPQSWILSDGTSIPVNLTIFAGQGLSIRPVAVGDSGSPMGNLHCAIDNGSFGSFELDINPLVWWNPWTWDASMNDVEATLTCTIRDLVNNSSPEFYTTFSFDFSLPVISSTLVSGYIPSDWGATISLHRLECGLQSITDITP